MQALSQINPTWAHKTIGLTNHTLGRWGCTITSLCMLLSKFHPWMNLKPDEAAKLWTFNDRGEIIWSRSAFKGMTFIKRGYGNNHTEIVSYAQEEDYGVILEVNHSHWIAVKETNGIDLAIHDPIDGSVYKEVPGKYYISGYAVFHKEPIEVEIPKWAKDAVAAAKKHGIEKFDNMHGELSPQKVEWIMEDLGVREKHQGTISELEFIVCLYRLGIFK